jgi:hypothetical protein
MANKQINNYTAAVSIDPVNDLMLIQPGGSGVYNSINRNVLMGVTGTPADLSTAQALTNKTIGNTNSITQKDGSFTLQNTADTTKQAVFSLSGITTGTTRTYTLPNVSDTLTSNTATQTLTNKTITSPTISGGTIDNSTITVDSIAGHTSSTTGTIYGMSITTGTIGSAALAANSVTSAAIATNAVQASNLATNAITLGKTSITGSINTQSTTPVQATGLTSTVTIPSGGRNIKVTLSGGNLSVGTGSKNMYITLWRGAVGSGTQIGGTQFTQLTANFSVSLTLVAYDTPSAGSVTYNAGFYTDSGPVTLTWTGSSTSPVLLLVEAI